MSTYSLLQVSQDQTIDRSSLEDASVVVRSVARGDCARLHRELFGILISGLAREDAEIFQAELKRRDFPTDVVADQDLPQLHEPFTVQRFEVKGDVLLFTDFMGRIQTRPSTDLVFLAGGFLTQVEIKTDWEMHVKGPRSTRGGAPTIEIEKHRWEEDELEFRLDFFFWAAPNRVRLALTGSTAIFYQGQPLRLRHPDGLLRMMTDLLKLLPKERVTAGLRRDDARPYYPSVHCYEEEIRWHFYHLKSPA
ncbi:MAG: hypothetical protein V4819_00095 [Verrucomicrobiota bacterium]